MKHTAMARVLALIVVCTVPTLVAAGDSTTARYPRNFAEFDKMFNEVKSWVYGPGDQLGAANLVTDAKRREAIALAKLGTVVSLAHPPLTEKAPDNPQPFGRTMIKGIYATDTYSVSYHGFAHSHIDSLCHYNYKGQVYNGLRTEDVHAAETCAQLGIDALKGGVVTRGILIDIPSLVEGMPFPVHVLSITALGVNILDNQDLEAVAETAARLKRWEFMLTVGPIAVPGGTGSPVNALAIF